jgi:glycosyltransferase involved in cell wall biosynthesis
MSGEPFISILMPIRNEADFIRRSLGAVLAQDYPAAQLEILVADGLSTDGTREIVQSLQTQYPHLHLLDNPDQIVPTGLNAALRLARGAIIIRIDGHCEIATDYVRRCVEHLEQEAVDGVGGSVETVGETPVAQAIAVAMSSRFGVGDSSFRVAQGVTQPADTVPFPAYTRAIMDQAGPYDEELARNQDDEYNYRLRKLGAKILLTADLRSRYYSRASFAGLWRQYFQYGFWKVRVLQKHPRQMRPRQFVPPVLVASVLGLALSAIFYPPAGWLLGLVLSVYGIANLMTSLWITAQKGWRHLLLLPIAFAILHFSYGLGFLVGLVKFWNRWGDTRGRTPTWEALRARSG